MTVMRIAVLATIASCVALCSAVSAEAASIRGPSSVTVGKTVTVTARGFPPKTLLRFGVREPTVTGSGGGLRYTVRRRTNARGVAVARYRFPATFIFCGGIRNCRANSWFDWSGKAGLFAETSARGSRVRYAQKIVPVRRAGAGNPRVGTPPWTVTATSGRLVVAGVRLLPLSRTSPPTRQRLERAWGRPVSVRKRSGSCELRWRRPDLTVTLFNLAGRDPCGRRTGVVQWARTNGGQWRTSTGLSIGDPATEQVVQAAFPRAVRRIRPREVVRGGRVETVGEYPVWLAWPRPTVIGPAGETSDLQVREAGGKVAFFYFNVGAAGE